jgi:hypothetical protein
MKLLGVFAGSVALISLGAPAQAVVLNFVGGHANIEGPASTDPATPGTGFTDSFTFDTTGLSSVSGSLTTHWLTDANGNVVEDLDFTSITLDGILLTNNSTSDANEEWALPSSPLSAGPHTLLVNYNIDTASADNHAAYSGDLYLTAAAPVPEAASWAMFIGGFGMIGAGLRTRRRTRVAFAI